MSAQLDDAGGITDRSVTEGELRWVALADVDDPGDNVRADLRGLEELVESVRAHGVLQPVALEPQGAGRYRIAAGFRRCAAARAAGLAVVPAMVREASPVERVERQLVENLQREALTPLEEGRAYRRLCDLGSSQRRVARAVGRSQSHVSRRLAILQLPEEALRELETGRLSVEDAERLIPLRAWPERVRRALAHRQQWGGVARIVEQELRELREEETRAAAMERLRAEHPDARVIDAPRHGWYGEKTQPLGRGHVNVSLAKHAVLTCHAAAIGRDGTVTWVCTRPEVHAQGARDQAGVAKEEARQREERARRRAEGKALREAQQRRAVILRAALQETTARRPQDALLTIARQWIATAPWGGRDIRVAVELLELEPGEGQWGGRDYTGTLQEYTARGDDEAVQAALALALAIGEDPWRNRYAGGRRLTTHSAYLAARGYEVGPEETALMTTTPSGDGFVADAGEDLDEDGQEDDVARCRVCGGRGQRHQRSCSRPSAVSVGGAEDRR